MPQHEGISVALDSLKKAILELAEVGYPIGKLRAVYAELYVARKLGKWSPQIGDMRDVISADIYLPEIAKRVEVKAVEKGVMSLDYEWCWSISPRQLEQRKFDYLILLAFEHPLTIAREFVFTYDELRRLKPRSDFMRNTYGLCYDSRGDISKISDLGDRMLNERPENYESRWDKIKG